MEESEHSTGGTNPFDEAEEERPDDPLSIDLFEPSAELEFLDPNETRSFASSASSTDEHTIPGLIAYYRANGAAVKQESLAIILETLDTRILKDAAKIAERDEEIRRCHNVLVNITGVLTKRLFQTERHMDMDYFATTFADELRRVGINPGPAYNQ
ncbi:hypothetical protein AAVH_22901 [Aphelenchoides avenae]|nr:hypothetical protein AAVH_22901 [Aphelenchus avenae]